MTCSCRFVTYEKVEGHLIGCSEVRDIVETKQRLDFAKALIQNKNKSDAALLGCGSHSCSCQNKTPNQSNG